jgi:predicted pyridoxine 5'-phosphate oxidase superfamily flavin-nucleotide-binding protein
MDRLIPLSSTWHAGERLLQQKAGLAERMAEIGPRVIRDVMPAQHQQFFAMLSYAVTGSVDPQGDAWATVLTGAPGFLHALDARHLAVSSPRTPHDPANAGMNDGDAIGLLGIDLATRRRNRLNGTLRRSDANGFIVEAAESFGNCPQYIWPRRVEAGAAADEPAGALRGTRLDANAAMLIANAGTFFVASYADTEDGRRVDVSHRGGLPGFVKVEADGVLTIPDYAGNRFYNTLGNLVVNPKAGLVFVDFASGGLLQLTGDAEVLPDGLGTADFRGAERLWRVTPCAVVQRPHALPLRWSPPPVRAA